MYSLGIRIEYPTVRCIGVGSFVTSWRNVLSARKLIGNEVILRNSLCVMCESSVLADPLVSAVERGIISVSEHLHRFLLHLGHLVVGYISCSVKNGIPPVRKNPRWDIILGSEKGSKIGQLLTRQYKANRAFA